MIGDIDEITARIYAVVVNSIADIVCKAGYGVGGLGDLEAVSRRFDDVEQGNQPN